MAPNLYMTCTSCSKQTKIRVISLLDSLERFAMFNTVTFPSSQQMEIASVSALNLTKAIHTFTFASLARFSGAFF